MGIRIHKCLGYGLTGIEVNETTGVVTDSRFNQDFIEKEGTYNNTGYFEFLGRSEPTRSSDNINNCITLYHDDYSSSPASLVIRPFGFTDWSRYDDIIDYVESTYLDPCSDHVQVFNAGIYPFIGDYMDRRTGESVKDGTTLKRAINSNSSIDTARFGFKDIIEAKEYLTPSIPKEIQDICEYTGMFNDKSTILHLQPILLTYWG